MPTGLSETRDGGSPPDHGRRLRNVALRYLDLVRISLSDIARTALEDLMAGGNYEFQSDFARKHRGAGREEGRAEGREEGRAEGREEGRAEGRADAVAAVLRARGLDVSDAQKARILACTELDVLDRWIRKAVVVRTTDELFED